MYRFLRLPYLGHRRNPALLWLSGAEQIQYCGCLNPAQPAGLLGQVKLTRQNGRLDMKMPDATLQYPRFLQTLTSTLPYLTYFQLSVWE